MSREPMPAGLSLLESMLLIRAYEGRLVEINRTTGAAGTCTSIGQEAAAVGVVHALEPRDRILTNHRSAGHLLARGAAPGRMMAEVLGRVDGYCRGKSGSLHISARELGVVLTSTIVGGELAMATGVALAQAMGRGEAGGIVAAFFGDGAACEGIFHESLNLAATWRLPILYVCENNQWQAFVHRRETMPIDDIRTWSQAHGIESLTVDGNDVECVHAAARKWSATRTSCCSGKGWRRSTASSSRPSARSACATRRSPKPSSQAPPWARPRVDCGPSSTCCSRPSSPMRWTPS